ncbi:MAG: SAM-dependent methyltransferase [Pseudonocardiaceae bacterium]
MYPTRSLNVPRHGGRPPTYPYLPPHWATRYARLRPRYRHARAAYIDTTRRASHGFTRAQRQGELRNRPDPADIFEPRQVLGDEIVRKHLDFSQPIALFHLGTLHHYDGERSPASIMAEYIDALPSGSYVALSHFCDPENEYTEVAKRLEQVFVHSPLGSGWFRTRAEIAAMLAGLDLIDPGLTRCVDWWPDGPHLQPPTPAQHCIVGAVGRKP